MGNRKRAQDAANRPSDDGARAVRRKAAARRLSRQRTRDERAPLHLRRGAFFVVLRRLREVLDPRVRYDPSPATERGKIFYLFQDSLFQSSIIDDWEMHLVNMVL